MLLYFAVSYQIQTKIPIAIAPNHPTFSATPAQRCEPKNPPVR
jgi:hypothetical protein